MLGIDIKKKIDEKCLKKYNFFLFVIIIYKLLNKEER